MSTGFTAEETLHTIERMLVAEEARGADVNAKVANARAALGALYWERHRLYIGKLCVAYVVEFPNSTTWGGWTLDISCGHHDTEARAKAAVLATIQKLIGATEGTI